MGSLRTKIFILTVTLLLLVQAVSLGIIYQANKQQAQQQIDLRLEAAIAAFDSQYQQRNDYLQAFAETAAKDFGLKEVFDADLRSFLIALNNHRKRIDADLAIAVNRENLITGQLLRQGEDNQVGIGAEQGKPFRAPHWFENKQSLSRLYELDGHVYQLSFAPLKSGQQIIGWIGYGYQINNRLAQNFAESTGLSIEFLLRSKTDNGRSLASATPSMSPIEQVSSGEELLNNPNHDAFFFTARTVAQLDERNLMAVIYGSRINLLEALRDNFWTLILIEGATILVSLLAAYLLAAGISNPVRRLVQQAQHIAKGNYDTQVEVSERNELGQLAHEFNHMQKAVVDRERTISHQLYHNTLTDIPNRNSLLEHLDARFADTQQAFTLLHLDIRRIRAVNDTLGYATGDRMIKEVGQRLQQLQVETFHLGADEFALILPTADLDEINRWQRTLDHAMDQPLCGEGTLLHLQLHIGFARAPEDAGDAHQLLQKADTALSHGKRDRHPFQRYLPSMDADADKRLGLVNDLKMAIESDDQLQLFYQPKLSVATGRIENVEALIRWIHPTQGMIPPDAFIGIAEQTGQIDALTRWVIRAAARQYVAWQSRGIDLAIAVNISVENLKNHHFATELQAILQQFSLPSHALALEVTESAVVSDPECALKMLCEIRNQGIKLSIDDYGTGYSSLAQLKQMPVSELKIDRSFVDKVHSDPDDQIIVRSTIRMAHDMGLTVVAEGIEDQETLDWLAQHGCDLAQGYFISRPLPERELREWLPDAAENFTEKA